jgi:hypothetical protein
MENDNRLAVEWQFKGHETKKEIHNLFMSFVVATIGFASSIVLLSENRLNILKNTSATIFFFISIGLLFTALFLLFWQSTNLVRIAFKYSEILGNKITDRNFKEVDTLHRFYYIISALAFILYVFALISLITSILIILNFSKG